MQVVGEMAGLVGSEPFVTRACELTVGTQAAIIRLEKHLRLEGP
jgi:hypothetical protein